MLTVPQVRQHLLDGVSDARAAGRLSPAECDQLEHGFRAMSDQQLIDLRERFADLARALLPSIRRHREVSSR